MRNVPCAGSFIAIKNSDRKEAFKVAYCGPEYIVAVPVHPSGEVMAETDNHYRSFDYGDVIDISDEIPTST